MCQLLTQGVTRVSLFIKEHSVLGYIRLDLDTNDDIEQYNFKSVLFVAQTSLEVLDLKA